MRTITDKHNMKIAILTSGIIPVPAVQGGAVENLVDFYLEYNNRHRLHDMTVYSVWHPDVEQHPAQNSSVNHYVYLKTNTLMAKFRKRLLHWQQWKDEYYDYTIEYYLHEAMKDIRKKHYDCIIIENRPGFALKLKDITDAKYVYHLHNEKLDSKTSHAQEIYDAASRIITVSDYIKSRVQTINPHDDKTITVHNGINIASFSRKASDAPAKLGFTSNDFILVFCGRITPEKGILELIEAMIRLKDYPHIKLLVLGSSFYGNTNKESDYIRTLKSKAATMQDRITFTGFIPYNQMPEYLRMSDIAVIPSIWDDPFPTTVLEAQAMGLPIIATRRGGIPEEVSEENAILLATDEYLVENLAATILDLYHHPEKRNLMSEASRCRSQLFDKETYAQHFFEVINQL